jgi:Fe-S-cluster containining protein
MSFGNFIRIERQLTDRDYYCRYGITGEVFYVHADPEFADEIAERYGEPGEKENTGAGEGCIFRCRNPDGEGFSCAVYQTRPNVCRAFRCYRMLIYDQASGELRGKIIGNAELRTTDEKLMAVWKETIAQLPSPVAQKNGTNPDERAWIDAVTAFLAKSGYRGEPAD